MLEISPLELLCSVCFAGGCPSPPPGVERIRKIIAGTKQDSWLPVRLVADTDFGFTPYQNLGQETAGGKVPRGFRIRRDDFLRRFQNLHILRLLGLQPGDIRPAYELVRLLFNRIEKLDGICRFDENRSLDWPKCIHARKRHYEKARGRKIMINEGISIGGKQNNPLYLFLTPRPDAEMAAAKIKSVEKLGKSERLFIRPNHLLCLVCLYGRGNEKPLKEDNLYEMRLRIQANPEIPITLVEGCCMACPPCPVYDPKRNLCYHAHTTNQLRDLMVLKKMGLRPGATLPARRMYERLFERIEKAFEVCGWGDGFETTAEWKTCSDAARGYYERARTAGFPDPGGHTSRR